MFALDVNTFRNNVNTLFSFTCVRIMFWLDLPTEARVTQSGTTTDLRAKVQTIAAAASENGQKAEEDDSIPTMKKPQLVERIVKDLITTAKAAEQDLEKNWETTLTHFFESEVATEMAETTSIDQAIVVPTADGTAALFTDNLQTAAYDSWWKATDLCRQLTCLLQRAWLCTSHDICDSGVDLLSYSGAAKGSLKANRLYVKPSGGTLEAHFVGRVTLGGISSGRVVPQFPCCKITVNGTTYELYIVPEQGTTSLKNVVCVPAWGVPVANLSHQDKATLKTDVKTVTFNVALWAARRTKRGYCPITGIVTCLELSCFNTFPERTYFEPECPEPT